MKHRTSLQTKPRPRLKLLALAACLASAPGVFAAPQGGTVVYGQATLQSRPNGLDIHQGTSKAIIDWNSFSVASGELVRIEQPSASAVLLNRVTGDNPSTILGQIQANGRVFLLNPRGILLGAGSRIDAGGFLASTLNLSNQDFLAGRIQLDAGTGTPGTLQADGVINAPGGTIALVAPQLTVTGTLEAQRVGLAAASSVRVDVEGDGLIFFDARNDGLAARLQMLGTLKADGGTAELRAQARAGFADTVLNMDGVVQARSLGLKNGKVVIDGGSDGVTVVSGRVDVSGSGAGESGGTATLLGDKLALLGSATVDASGTKGGGSIEIGGGFHGQGTTHNASQVYVSPGSVLRADALQQGDGGSVVVWSDDATRYFGRLSARGGALAGNGGSAEVSGAQYLDFSGTADLGATLGRIGTLLLDPLNLTIRTASPDILGTGGTADLNQNTLDWSQPNATTTSIITTGAIASQMTGGSAADVRLEAKNNITVSNALTVSTGSQSLTLNAGNSIIVSAPISIQGDLVLSANHTFATNGGSAASGTGGITFAGASLAGRNITLEGTGAVALPAITAGGKISVTTTGNITQTGALSVGAQNSSFTASGSGATITLGGANVFGANAVAFNSNGATTVSADRLNIGASDVGSLAATATGTVGIGQSGAITVHGASTFTATGTGATITLPGANVFGTNAVAFTSDGLTTVWADQLNLGTSNVGSLSATATGTTGIGQSGAITIHGASGFTATNTGAAIALGGSNVFGANAVTFASDAATTVSADQLNFGTSTVGSLNATATGTTGISQSGAITINGASSFSAANAGAAITLSGANLFGANAVAFTSNGATTVSADQLNFSASNVGSLGATATGATGIGQSGAITIHGASGFTATSVGAAITLGGSNVFGTNAVTFASNAATTVSADQLNFGTSTVGSLSATATGTTGISQSGAITINGASSFSAATAGAVITLSGANLFGANAVAFTSNGATTVSADQLNFSTSNVGSLGATATGTTGISQSGAITVHGASSFSAANAGAVITLSSANVFGANAIAFTSDGATTVSADRLNFNTSNVGSLAATATGTTGIGQSGAITIHGASSFGASSTGATITLGGANVFGANAVAFTSSAGTTVNADALNFATSQIGTTLQASTGSGGISQSGAVTTGASGSSFSVATGQSIDLSTQANSLAGLSSGGDTFTTHGDLALHNSGSIQMPASATSLPGKLVLISDSGSISQLGAFSVGADGSTFTANAAGQTITLAQANLLNGHTVSLNTGTGGASLTADAIKLAASNVGGPLTLTANSGAITQTAALTLSADGSSFTTLGTNQAITLTQANVFNGKTIALQSTGDASVRADAIKLAASTIGGKLTATATAGSISETGAIQLGADGSTFDASGAIDLSSSTNLFGTHDVAFSSGGDVAVKSASVKLAASNIGGKLTATATGGDITETGAIQLGAGGSSFGASGAIDLSTSTNLFGTLDVAFSSGGNVAVKSASLTFAASTIGGKLTATATAGGIAETGAIQLGADGSSFGASGSIDLSTSTNVFGGFDAAFSSGGDTAVKAQALKFAASSIGGKLNAEATTGAITQSGAFSVGADGNSFTTAGQGITLTQSNVLNGKTVALNTGNSGGNVGITSADALKFATSNIGGTLTALASNGAISQTGAVTTHASGSSFTASGTGHGIDLSTQANSLAGLTAGGDTFSTQQDLALRNVGSIQMPAAGASLPGKLVLVSDTGSIGQVGAFSVGADGSTFTTSTAGQTITLSQANLLNGHTVSLNTSGSTGSATLKADAIKLATSNVGGPLTLTASTGGITQTAALTLNADGSNFTTSTNGQAITLTQANVFNGKTLALHSGGDASVTADAIKLAASSIGGKLVATASTGGITQSGVLSVNADGSDFITSAAGQAVTLTQANVFNGKTLALHTGGDATVTADAIKLAASAVGGKLVATASTGGITQSGALSVNADGSNFTTTTTGQAIVLGGANVLNGKAVALHSAGDATLTADAITLAASTVAGKLTATASTGAIAQTGTLSLGADGSRFTTSGAGRAITLTQANVFGGKSVAFTTNGGDVSLQGDALNFGTSTIGGKLVANATAGDIGQVGAISVGADGSGFTASQAITLTLANQVGGHTVALNSSGDAALTADAFTLAGGTIGGKLTATATTGSIGQTGALSLGADGSRFSAAQGITLTAANLLNGKTVALSSGADAALTADGILLDASSIGGKLTLNASAGGIAQTGALTLGADGSSFSAAQAIVLDQGGNVFAGKTLALTSGSNTTLAGDAFTLAASNIGGPLVINASGAIAQTGALTLHADGNSFSGSSITLDQAGNALGGKSIALNTAGDATLAGDQILLSGATIGGALNLQATNSIAQGGTLAVGGLSTLRSAGSGATVVLADAANQFGGGVQLSGATPFQSATLSGAGTLTVGGDAVQLTLSGDGPLVLAGGNYSTLNLASGRGLSQLGAISVSGETTLTATGSAPLDASLDNAGNELHTVRLAAGGSGFGSIALRDADTRANGLVVGGDAAQLNLVALGGVTLAGGHYGTLDVQTAGGLIGQSGALTVDGLSTLNAGSGNIVLDTATNDFATISLPAAAHATLVDANDLTLTDAHVSGTLNISVPGTAQFTGDFTGTALLIKQGSGVLIVGTGLGNLGGTDLQSGTLVLSGAGAHLGPGTLTLGPAGTLELRDGADFTNALLADGGLIRGASGSSRIDGAMTFGADTIFEVGAGANLQLAGTIAETGGARSLVKTGEGLLQISGSDTRQGATFLNAGTLLADGALSANSALTLATGTLLQLGADQTIGSLAGSGRVALGSFRLAAGADQSSTSFSGGIDGSGGLTKLGDGTLTLSGSNTQTGTTLLQAGTLVLAGGQAQADGAAVNVATGATLSLAGDETIGALLGSGKVLLADSRLTVDTSVQDGTFAGSITGAAGGLSKAGSGTLTLSGTGDWQGETRVDAGRLLLASVNALPANTAMKLAAGATLATGQALSLSALNGAGTVELDNTSALLTVGAGGASSAFAGSITGSGGLAKTGTGTLLLSGANSFTGAVAIDAGTLQLDGGAALADTAQVAVASGARLNLLAGETIARLTGPGLAQLDNGARLALGGDGADSVFAGTLAGSGSLSKQGAGTLVLTGDNSYAGGTLIESGTLQIGSGGASATTGSLGSGAVDDRGLLRFARSDAVTLDNAITGSGGLELTQGRLTLGSTQNAYAGTTQVTGGALLTGGAERLPDASAVNVAAGATLTLAGSETIASLSADGMVTVNGNVVTTAGQRYGGGLTIASATPVTLQAGGALEALQSSNQFGSQPLNLNADSVQLLAPQDLTLGTVQLAQGGQISAEHLTLQGTLTQAGGTLALIARAAPDATKAQASPTAIIPLTDKALALAEATLVQADGSSLNIADGATLTVSALGSINLNQESNQISGGLQILSGAAFNTAWSANVQGTVGIQGIVKLAGQQLNIAGSGIEADVIEISAAKLATTGSAVIAARLPYDNVAAGTTLSQPGLLLNLLPGAFTQDFSFGAGGDSGIQVSIGARAIGNRTDGPDSGFLTVRPLAGAQGNTAIFLLGPVSGGGAYSLFHDGAGKGGEIPVFYNNVLPAVPQLTSALSSVTAVSESSRRDRFEEAVRTENVTVRLRSGVIAEVGPGRAATTGSGGVQAPPSCENASCAP